MVIIGKICGQRATAWQWLALRGLTACMRARSVASLLQGSPLRTLSSESRPGGSRRKLQSSAPSTLPKAGRKPFPCVGSLSDSQDLAPNMQGCPAPGGVFFAVKSTACVASSLRKAVKSVRRVNGPRFH